MIHRKLMIAAGLILVLLSQSNCTRNTWGTTHPTRVTVVRESGTTTISETNVNHSDTAMFFKAAEKHAEAEAGRIETQSSDISTALSCDGCSASEKVLSGVIAALAIKDLRPTAFALKKPKTGWDVADTVAGQAAAITGIVTGGVVANDVLTTALGVAGDKIITQISGDANGVSVPEQNKSVESSFNPTTAMDHSVVDGQLSNEENTEIKEPEE